VKELGTANVVMVAHPVERFARALCKPLDGLLPLVRGQL
jgi:hypothetical protein